ncbi:MAG: (2Fe-2S)-binding protein [Gemmataceae bacterium]
MPSSIAVTINGRPTEVSEGCTVAAAVMLTSGSCFRLSVTGQPRGPLCGMGVCFECRVTIDGQPQQRSCQTLCREGMCIVTACDTGN